MIYLIYLILYVCKMYVKLMIKNDLNWLDFFNYYFVYDKNYGFVIFFMF